MVSKQKNAAKKHFRCGRLSAFGEIALSVLHRMPKQIGDHFSQRLAEVPKQKVDFRMSLRGGCETIQSQSPPNKLEDLPKQYQTTSPCKVHLGDPVRVRSYAKSIKKYFVLFQCIKRI